MLDSGDTVIQVRGLTKEYDGVTALTGVDLDVRRGEVVAVLGPNGAGKSTMFEVLLGLLRPSAGTVEVLGGVPDRTTRLRIGTMMQSAGLPEAVTVAELVRLVGTAHPRMLMVEDALGMASLLPHAGRRVTDLSGGERQRLQLAAALVGAPELLMLDEPTAALDVRSRRAFWTHTQAAVEAGVTVVFATHDLADAQSAADRVVVIDQGRVLADASPRELTGDGDRDLEEVFLALTEESSVAAHHPQTTRKGILR